MRSRRRTIGVAAFTFFISYRARSRMRRALRRASGRAWPSSCERPFISMFFVTRANPLTILLFHGDASSSSSPVAFAHAHRLPRAIAMLIGRLAGQRLLALGGSARGRFVQSPRRLAATAGRAAAAAVVLAYGVPSFAHV
ncbi:hypothetical protein WG70_11415 [Burkholderia oklahomensis EO147]|nr:hypothetical protein WG70_11415 [Burkholderia oklahomensis EO147]KUY58712.1 hypothetical protein WG70_00160 [Burkholderia oklahomensis EO147]QPS39474.1 hypothetical protein I6G57_26895 [Burkholderia oklahomensis]